MIGKNVNNFLFYKEFIGAGEGNRTSDLLITNQLLYRLSYTGAGCGVYRENVGLITGLVAIRS